VVTNTITEHRIARNISKAYLARRIGRSRAYVTLVEQGKLQVGAKMMLVIAKYFGKPLDDIFKLGEQGAKEIEQRKESSGKSCNQTIFPSVPGCGQEQQTMPGTINSKRK
jgi:transcriptional regulator with XRE-family HTH domain